MTEQPGLFALPDPPSVPPARAPRDRGRRGEHWIRPVVADLHIVDSRALREATFQLRSKSVTINLGAANDEPDLLDEHQEIATSNAAAARWWIDHTTGMWPELAEALRIDIVDIDATEETTRRVRAHWSVSVTITDLHLLRSRTGDSPLPDESFPELWNRTADPFAPLAGLHGATWEPIAVEVTRGR
jgi:hypothetical protein